MAEVSLSPSARTLSTMSSRSRVPLSSNPNAINVNSPYRAAASKAKRSYANIQREEAYGQPPPAKKQMVESKHIILRTPPRQQSTQTADGRLFTRKPTASQSLQLNQRLAAAATVRTEKTEKTEEENLEDIRQWQRHYRRVFPKFVFYFESIPDDVRQKHAKQVIALGAVRSYPLVFSDAGLSV
jgi:regulatory subunit for Cdc7p protein kinase